MSSAAPPDEEQDSTASFETVLSDSSPQSIPVAHSSVSVVSSSPAGKFLDWTRTEIKGASPYIRFLRGYDWPSTSLGPMDNWTWPLRQVLVTMMMDPDPRVLLWGPERVIVYNEASIPLIGSKHPHALGKGPEHTFAEVWTQLAPLVDLAFNQGQTTKVEQMPLTMERSGYAEETFWSFSMLPVLGEDGCVAGALDQFTDRTRVVIAERRMRTVLDIGQRTAFVDELEHVWGEVLDGLEKNKDDVPLALLYSIVDQSDFEQGKTSTTESLKSSDKSKLKRCVLRGVVGISEDNEAAVQHFALSEGDDGYSVKFREAWESKKPVLLQAGDGNLPSALTNGVPGRSAGVGCNKAIILPVPPTSGSGILGFLILGLSPRCPWDDEYKLFIRLLSERLVTSAAAVSLPQEQRRAATSAEEAALRHAALSRELSLRTQEAERSEAKFTRMASQAPVGMYMIDKDLNPIYLNEVYYVLTGSSKDNKIGWRELVHPEDVQKLDKHLREVIDDMLPATFEYRLKRPWKAIDKASGHEMSGSTWLLATMFPELGEDGSVQAIMGWLSDISLTKWTEDLQKRQLEEALELKRQKENFIDITSHEVRNPLSAIIQSADSILAAIKDANSGDSPSEDSAEVIVDAAQTILLCAQHQKRIVDDILTLSKLDSNLLLIAPDKVEPKALVKKALKMYEAELQSAEIEAVVLVDPSYNSMAVEEVVLDPSRLLQVLINLLTNAIKFTRNQARRKITISLSASKEKPASDLHGMAYIRQRDPQAGPSFGPEWGSSSTIYLQFAVEDTGRGLTAEEMNMLFLRFSQASPRTYGKYGGSGLGLFISRELTELQGGQIGVSSESGEGSTFAFYVKALQLESRPSHKVSDSSVRSARVRNGKKSKDAGYPFPPTPQLELNNGIGSAPTVAGTSARRDSPLHVLVVEDNDINQKVLAQQLRRLGIVVYVASDGLEALSFLNYTTFSASQMPNTPLPTSAVFSPNEPSATPIPLSCVLMDLEMPRMDGLTCIKKIRDLQREGELVGHVPVIAVTANSRHEQISNALEHGMDSVVTKPFRIPDLVPQMEALVSGMAATNMDPVFSNVDDQRPAETTRE